MEKAVFVGKRLQLPTALPWLCQHSSLPGEEAWVGVLQRALKHYRATEKIVVLGGGPWESMEELLWCKKQMKI